MKKHNEKKGEESDGILLRRKFLIEYDVDFDKEFDKFDTVEVDVIKSHIMTRGFSIICYPCCNDSLPDCRSVLYEIFFGDKAKGNVEISKEQALLIIESHNLLLLIDSDDGKIWE